MRKTFYVKMSVSENATENDISEMLHSLKFRELHPTESPDVQIYDAHIIKPLYGDDLENELYSIIERAINHILTQRGHNWDNWGDIVNQRPEIKCLKEITDMEKGKAAQHLMKSGIDVHLLER